MRNKHHIAAGEKGRIWMMQQMRKCYIHTHVYAKVVQVAQKALYVAEQAVTSAIEATSAQKVAEGRYVIVELVQSHG